MSLNVEFVRMNMITNIPRLADAQVLRRNDHLFVSNLSTKQYSSDQFEGVVLNFLEGVMDVSDDQKPDKPYWDHLQLICDDATQKWCFRVSVYGLQLEDHCRFEL